MARQSRVPEDMIREILLRLPVKSLLRFKTICKNWLALLSSSYFIDTHYQRRPKQSIMLSHDWPFKNYFVSLIGDGEFRLYEQSMGRMIKFSTPNANIMGSSNGLVCVCVTNKHNIDYILWNPSTRKYRHLPSPLYKIFSHYRCPSASGFTFLPEINDYKLVIVDFTYSRCLKAEVFTLRTSSWKKVKVISPISGCVLCSESSVVVKGFLYHMAYQKGNPSEQFIVKFDMRNEAFSKMDVGLHFDDVTAYDMKLMVYKELLAMSCLLEVKASFWKLEIWTLKNEGWTKLFTCKPFSHTASIQIWNDKEIIIREKFRTATLENLILCDLLTQKSYALISAHRQFREAHDYVESLVSISIGDEDSDNVESKTGKKTSSANKKRGRIQSGEAEQLEKQKKLGKSL